MIRIHEDDKVNKDDKKFMRVVNIYEDDKKNKVNKVDKNS